MAVLSGKVKLQGRTTIRTENQYRSRAGSWLIDAEKKLIEKGPGYAQWARRHNLKQVSKSFLFLRDQKIRGLSHLSSLVEEKTKARDELLDSIKASEARLAEIATLKKHIINYSKTRSTYAEYRKLRDEAQELVIAENNLSSLFEAEREEQNRQREKEH